MKKICSDDPLVHYKNSTVSPDRTKAEIDGVLAEWQVKDVHWHWDMEHNDVYVQFKLDEVIDELPVAVVIKVECPIVWDKAKPRGRPPQPERINWRVSMRAMWWFIKTNLEMAYVRQSQKTIAFLPYIKTTEETTLKDLIVPRLQRLQEIAALPESPPEKQDETKIVDVEGCIRRG